MSRHQIRPRDPAHKVIIGWDPMLETYFAQVIDRKKESAGEDEKFVLWIGCTHREITEIDELRRRLKPFAYLSGTDGTKLYGDMDAGR